MQNRLQDAIDYAITKGLVKVNTRNELTHAPLTLIPYEISNKVLQKMIDLTPIFNQLMVKVGLDRSFLQEHLEGVIQADDFTRNLLSIMTKSGETQPFELLISRNDFFLTTNDASNNNLKQVEYNTIASSYGFLSGQVHQLHKYLYQGQSLESLLVANNPLEGIVDAMATAVHCYNHTGSCVLMVIQPGEKNRFDQRAIEYRLLNKYNIPTLRCSLDEIGEKARLKEGHLTFNDRIMALTYFRAGYTPDDYPSQKAWKARELIESSSSIKCPSIGVQLAGTKKIQQVLGRSDILNRFIPKASTTLITNTFVDMFSLNETINNQPAHHTATCFPEKYVLKPQREGGGNNYFGQEMADILQTMPKEQQEAYILMERIEAPTHSSILVVDKKTNQSTCVSEIGRFGTCFTERDKILLNQDIGYLVRTKSEDQDEGGVSAGYACLNSLCLRADR